MVQIGNVAEINTVKKHLNDLQDKGYIEQWELPYENILTRLTAAIFFITPLNDSLLDKIWDELNIHDRLTYRPNHEKKLSLLEWRVEFNKNFEL